MSDLVQPNITAEPLTQEWAEQFFMAHGVYPMAGADGAEPEGGGGEPEGGEGGQGEGDGLYDLSSVPEELRSHIEPHLKAIEANVTKKFQEHSAYRDGWKPYEELGVNDIDPEQLSRLIEFAKLAQDEDQFGEWWHQVGEQMGLYDKFGGEPNPLDLSEFAGTPEEIQKIVSDALEEKLNPLQEAMKRSEDERHNQETEADVNRRIQALVDEHGEFDRDVVLQLGLAYVQEDPTNAIERGFEDYKRIVTEGEKNLFERKEQQPPAPEGSGGQAATQTEKITSFAEAKAAAAERMRAARAAAT